MPGGDVASILVSCSNAIARESKSWVLDRLLRDHEICHDVNPRNEEEGGKAESLRIGIFNLCPIAEPKRDLVWRFGWLVILLQIGIAVPPWVLCGDWGVMMITLGRNLLVAVTCPLPQWREEKWAGRALESKKVTCLTRGNGSLHIMVFIGEKGCWDLESLAKGTSVTRPETRWAALALTVFWACLLISVSGLKNNAWFLIGIGGCGMLQNVFAAGTPRTAAAHGFHHTPFARAPTIVGRRRPYPDDEDDSVDLEELARGLADLERWCSPGPSRHASAQAAGEGDTMPVWLSSMSGEDDVPEWLEAIQPDKRDGVIYAVGVHGALMELEKWVPAAGLAMVQMFFPSGLKYNQQSVRDNVHKKFWKRAYHTAGLRKRAEEKRRRYEESQAGRKGPGQTPESSPGPKV